MKRVIIVCLLIALIPSVVMAAVQFVTVTNGDFTGGLAGWTHTGNCATWEIAGGALQTAGECTTAQSVRIEQPAWYTVTLDHNCSTGSTVDVYLAQAAKSCACSGVLTTCTLSDLNILQPGVALIAIGTHTTTTLDNISLAYDDSAIVADQPDQVLVGNTPLAVTATIANNSLSVSPVTSYTTYLEMRSSGNVTATQGTFTLGELALLRTLYVIAVLMLLDFVWNVIQQLWFNRGGGYE